MHPLTQNSLEHNNILETLAEFKLAVDTNSEPAQEVFDKLAEFLNEIVTHFDHEEKIMAESGYFDYEGHVAAHNEFIKTSGKIIQMIMNDLTYLPKGLQLIHDRLVSHMYVENEIYKHGLE